MMSLTTAKPFRIWWLGSASLVLIAALSCSAQIPEGKFTLERQTWTGHTQKETWTLRYGKQSEMQDGGEELDGLTIFKTHEVLITRTPTAKEKYILIHELLHVAFGSYESCYSLDCKYTEHDFIVPVTQVLTSILSRNPRIRRYLFQQP